MDKISELITYLQSSEVGQYITNYEIINAEAIIHTTNVHIKTLMLFLRDNSHYSFQMLIDLCGVDYPYKKDRFEIVYNLLSITANLRLRVKLAVDNDINVVSSIADIYSAASWYEREAWDMYGICFAGHDDLRRILTDYEFVGHPMRKDFPLTGFEEVRYDIEQGKVIYEKVKLTQDFRNFDFTSPWSNPDYILPGDEKAISKD